MGFWWSLTLGVGVAVVVIPAGFVGFCVLVDRLFGDKPIGLQR